MRTKPRTLERRNCLVCGQEFIIRGARDATKKLCSRACVNQFAEGRIYSVDQPDTNFVRQDAKFCAAMVTAGYEMTGPDLTPCTGDPITMRPDRPIRQSGDGYAW